MILQDNDHKAESYIDLKHCVENVGSNRVPYFGFPLIKFGKIGDEQNVVGTSPVVHYLLGTDNRKKKRQKAMSSDS